MKSIWSKTISPGGKWSGTIGRGKLLRFTALKEGANLVLLMYNARDLQYARYTKGPAYITSDKGQCPHER